MKKNIPVYLTIIVLIACNIILFYNSVLSKENRDFAFNKEFPVVISGWTSTDTIYDKDVLSVLDTDKIIFKNFSKHGSSIISVFMGCYNSLEKADASHSPIVCFTGQGWEIDKAQKVSIPLNDGAIIDVNQLIQRRLDVQMITLYWYQTAENAYPNRGLQKLVLLKHRLFGQSVNNAFVRVTIALPKDGSLTDTSKILYQFISDAYPEIEGYLI